MNFEQRDPRVDTRKGISHERASSRNAVLMGGRTGKPGEGRVMRKPRVPTVAAPGTPWAAGIYPITRPEAR